MRTFAAHRTAGHETSECDGAFLERTEALALAPATPHLSDDEAAKARSHLAHCASCRAVHAAMDEERELFAVRALTLGDTAPADVPLRVFAAARTETRPTGWSLRRQVRTACAVLALAAALPLAHRLVLDAPRIGPVPEAAELPRDSSRLVSSRPPELSPARAADRTTRRSVSSAVASEWTSDTAALASSPSEEAASTDDVSPRGVSPLASYAMSTPFDATSHAHFGAPHFGVSKHTHFADDHASAATCNAAFRADVCEDVTSSVAGP